MKHSINNAIRGSTYGYMRQKELLSTCYPVSPATLWRKVKDGTFVRPVKLSARITAWSRAEVQAWFEQQGAQK
jgi:predicted DNA-binding transcriptional regulator AlpA